MNDIERVARVLYDRWPNGDRSWDDASPRVRRQFEKDAEAAITAIEMVRDHPFFGTGLGHKGLIVDSNAVQETFARFTSEPKEIISITDAGDPQQHVLAGNIMSPQTTGKVTNNILEFIRQLP